MDWKYYNHAMISNTAPDVVPDLKPILDGTIWKKTNGNIPLLATWTTDFNCDEKTNWWYIIKKAPYVFEDLDKRKKKQIRRASNRIEVIKIEPINELDNIWSIYKSAFARYDSFDNFVDEKSFKENIDYSLDWWMAYDKETHMAIGWMNFQKHINYVTIVSAKYDPNYMKYGTSAAIYNTILSYYLNEVGFSYIESGERSINHETNVQQYKIDTFKFQKVYCKLNVAYNPKIRWIVKALFPFRKLFRRANGSILLHQLNSVLLIEEIVRGRDS